MHVRFQRPTAFARELKERVAAHLASQDDAAVRRAMLRKTALISLWFASSYVMLVFVASSWWQAVPLAISLGLSMAAIGMAIQHDANHGAYPVGPRARRLLGFSLDVLGGSSYVWRHQHNVNHHAYTNVAGADADINIGILARIAPSQPLRRIHRYQHIYLWPAYSLLVLNWMVWADWRDLARSAIGENAFRGPRGAELVALIAGKLLSAALWLGIPLLFHPPAVVFAVALLTVLVLGFTLAVVFQLAHVVTEVDFPALAGDPARSSDDWMVHQLRTTANFAPNSRLLGWVLGGLNHQIEHHLFPRVCHLHYPALSRIVAETCHEYGVPYHVHATVGAALRSHVQLLRQMGRENVAEPARASA